MKTNQTWMRMTGFILAVCSGPAIAGQVATSARAGSDGYGPGTAAATATYDGNGVGYTQTRTHSGRLNLARGVSVGIDEDGVMLSTSYAIAPTRGAAVAGSFNLRIGRDGSVAGGAGQSVATGSHRRSVNASGFVSRHRYGRPRAGTTVGGSTGRRGRVSAVSRSYDRRPHGHRVVLKHRWGHRY